ncbi:signal peptidase I [Amnibacterium endophyticum]|uniref:Signal peptidase I n=1 Tax=Amnibacterium endophyticum TaxID=2109337 RepID=A0ABW4LFG8_9MICO
MVQSPPREAPDRRRRDRGAVGFLRDLVVIVVVAVLASFLIKTFLIRSFFIPSESMENTLQVHDRILVNELVPGLIPLQRGDVVVFKDPDTWLVGQEDYAAPPSNALQASAEWVLSLFGLSAQDANDHLVKRVIGLPGDHVTCCNALGQLSVNGTPVQEPYVVKQPGTDRVSEQDFDVTVPAGELWVMGDNRYNSEDSRYHPTSKHKGFVPLDDVVGRAFVVSWPVSHWSWLSNYPGSFAGVGPPSK